MKNFYKKLFEQKIGVNDIVAFSLCIALLVCIFLGQVDLSQSIAIGLLGFLSKAVGRS